MKIIRGNLEFELTDEELQNAYDEQRLKWDVESISCGWVCENVRESNKYWAEIAEKVSKDESLLEQVAKRYRKYLDDMITGEDEIDCFQRACVYILEI